MRTIGYVRCARESGSANSFGHQRAEVEERLGRDGHTVDEWVEELGSGTVLRAAFDGLLARAEAGERMEIHVARLDRVARDAAALGQALRRAVASGSKIVANDSALSAFSPLTPPAGPAKRRSPRTETRSEASRG